MIARRDHTTRTGRGAPERGPLGALVAFFSGGSARATLSPNTRVIVGRARDAGLWVDDESVSRRHLEVIVKDRGVDVVDLGSRNGSFACGERLERGRAVSLAPGDVVRVGSAVVLWEADAPPASAQDAPSSRSSLATPLAEVQRIADLVAAGAISVLITGETGAGKEVLSSRIHARSPRAKRPFVRVNCAALPEPLLEAELFGYERGAFTGAVAAKPGLIESAHGGTLLLDEVGDLPLGLQAKLLRVLEAREATRLGSVCARAIDVRFLAATNRDLRDMVERRLFRADLLYRLNGITLRLPPLRERRDDIASLAIEFADQASRELRRAPARVAPDALAALVRYDWPGNIRELRNTIECAVLLCEAGIIRARDLRLPAEEPSSASAGSLSNEIAALERSRVVAALAEANGNQTRAARLLGVSRQRLIARMEAFALPRPRKA